MWPTDVGVLNKAAATVFSECKAVNGDYLCDV